MDVMPPDFARNRGASLPSYLFFHEVFHAKRELLPSTLP
jgi:hypothetical protein